MEKNVQFRVQTPKEDESEVDIDVVSSSEGSESDEIPEEISDSCDVVTPQKEKAHTPIREIRSILSSKDKRKKSGSAKKHVRIRHQNIESKPGESSDFFSRRISTSEERFVREIDAYQHEDTKTISHKNEYGFLEGSNKLTDEQIMRMTGSSFIKKQIDKRVKGKDKSDKKTQYVRIKKWQRMLETYPYKGGKKKDTYKVHSKLKSRARKGIPDSFRGTAWKTLACIEEVKEENSSVTYFDLFNEESKKDIDSIMKDISRTFPNHCFFKKKFGRGQKALFNVLRAIANYVKESGYVQGMGYISAILLMYIPEEEAFWTMASILSKYDHIKYFKPKMPGLWETFYVFQKLMKKKLPKVHDHLRNLNLCPSMYASQWFMTLCSVGFPYECTIRIFDCFLTEGPKVLYRVALYILKENEEELLLSEIEDVFAIVKIFIKNMTEDDIEKVHHIDIRTKKIQKYEQEYHSNPDKDILEFVKV
ncbi:unnamed protein product [Moneuplotes crassus]|uniref:Rab-GAP TBC domain-containing protein n=1 Tax=Euplotes crassus TaxID=5936 RepID=A0AAD1U3E4_EUPCR|nr:unnamed protein product [Moneuplotes crassus]